MIKAWWGCWQGVLSVTQRDAAGMSSAQGLRLLWEVQPWGLVGQQLMPAGCLHAPSFSLSLHKAFPASFLKNLFAVTSLQPMINSWGKTVPSLIIWQNVHLYSCITKTISISFAMLRKCIPCSKELLTCPGGGWVWLQSYELLSVWIILCPVYHFPNQPNTPRCKRFKTLNLYYLNPPCIWNQLGYACSSITQMRREWLSAWK